jgi:hypothetical protein
VQWTPEQLTAIHSLLPYTAQALIGCIGAEATALLLSARPGCEIRVPKHADKHPEGRQRWAELAEIIGEAAMEKLAARWGGDVLAIPVCKEARNELRDRAIRAEFDRLTMTKKLTGRAAVYEIGLKFAPLTSRAIEKICGRADFEPAAQAELF